MYHFWAQECRNYFHSAVAYVFIPCMLCVLGASTYIVCLAGREPVYEKALTYAALAFMLMVPVLTMRVFTEERREGILMFYGSLPIRMRDLVLGKYFALLCILGIPLAISMIYPIILSGFGSLSFRIIAVTYVGFFAMGGALLSIGILFSALLENQVAASAATFLCILGMYFAPTLSTYLPSDAATSFIVLLVVLVLAGVLWYVVTKSVPGAFAIVLPLCAVMCVVYKVWPEVMEGVIVDVTGTLSVYARFTSFADGLFDITTIIYDLVLSVLMLFLTSKVLEYRRMR